MAISFALLFITLGIRVANAHNHGMNTTQCNSCLEDNFDSCVNESEVQNCTSPATDSCYSAAGRLKFTNGSEVVFPGVARGCIACPNVTEGCRNFKIYIDSLDDWSLLDCNMVCCRGDQCNNQTVSLKPTEAAPTETSAMSNTTDKPTTAGHPSHYSATTAVLAFAIIIAVVFF